jgi:tRNA(fMet)-specific endonuclease VapC
MTRRFLLDTNHLSAAVNPRLRLRERLREAHRNGFVLGTCLPVLGELETGFQQTPDPERNRQALQVVRRHVRLWPLDEALARLYGEIYHDLRRRGRVLSAIDMLLAALCRHMGLTLLTSDRDFEALPELHIENWLAEETELPV